MSVSYRNATAADAPALDRIFRTTFCDTFGHLYRPEDLASFLAKFTPEAWASELDDPSFAFRIAEADSEAVGYAKLGPLRLPVEPDGPGLELYQLYVHKDWHGAGVAGQLMGWCLAEARSRAARQLYLTVYVDNHRARRFYERRGFVVEGPYAFMVGEQADEDLIMRLAL
ncbi:MAG TPA: GNAT family N-acetyltransferase [Sphingomicrobium sp.]|nr:GNAT family N-acetyltransferase [Sphingomicrobium sp.]